MNNLDTVRDSLDKVLQSIVATVSHVRVESGYEGKRFCAFCHCDNYEYHIWFNPDTLQLYQSKDKNQRVLYRREIGRKVQAYSLSIYQVKNAAIIVAMFDQIKKHNMVAELKLADVRATQALAEKQEQEHKLWLKQQAGPAMYDILKIIQTEYNLELDAPDAQALKEVLALAEKGKVS